MLFQISLQKTGVLLGSYQICMCVYVCVYTGMHLLQINERAPSVSTILHFLFFFPIISPKV